MANGKIIFTEAQRSFLLSPAAQRLRPEEAARTKTDEAYERFKEIRFGWTNGIVECAYCGASKPYELKNRSMWRCRKCGKQFSVSSGTIFSARKAPFTTILHAISLRIHAPNNALQMSYELGVQYNTAKEWAKKFRTFLGNIKANKTSDNRWPFVNGSRSEAHALVTLVNGAIPRSWPEQVRADVAQDMILGVLTGDISETDLEAHVRRYIRKHYKTVETPYAAISLDQPVPGTDGQSWADRLPDGTECGDRRYAD